MLERGADVDVYVVDETTRKHTFVHHYTPADLPDSGSTETCDMCGQGSQEMGDYSHPTFPATKIHAHPSCAAENGLAEHVGV